MKVLTVGNMYPPHHLGGYEIAWQGAVDRLREAGAEVRVLTTDFRLPGAEGEADEPDVHRELRWYWRDHEFPRMSLRRRLALERHNHASLAAHLTQWQPDVVCWWAMGGMSLSMLVLPARFSIPSMAVVCDDWLLYGSQVDGWQRMSRRFGPAAWPLSVATGVPAVADPTRAVDRWIFLSETVQERASTRWGAVIGRSEVAYPGVDPARFKTSPQHEWGWRLLYVGRLDPRKGVDLAIEALEGLPEARLRIDGGGDPSYKRELEHLASEIGVADRVEFWRSPRSALGGVYAASDAVLFPVRWEEPWGLVPLEAMVVGRPVVASGRGGSGEYLRDGENCLLAEPDDGPQGFVDAVRRLAADIDLRSSLVSEGMRTASRFPREAFDDAVLGVCEELAEEGRHHSAPGPALGSDDDPRVIPAAAALPVTEGLRRRAARGTVINSAFLVGLGTLNFVRAFAVAGFLTASEYGVWSILFLTLALVGGVKAAMVSDRYVQQTEADQERAFQKAFTLEVGSALATMLVLIALAPILALAYGEHELLLPCAVLALMLPGLALQSPAWVFYRRLDFAKQRTLQSVDPVVSLILTVGLAAAGLGYWSLVVGTIAGAWTGGLVALAYSPYRPKCVWEAGTVRDYAAFSAPLVVAMLAGMIMAQLSVFFGNLALGLGAAGAIGLASSFQAYTDRIDQVISSTLYPAVCKITDRAEVMAEVFVKSNRLALMWGMPFGIGLSLFAADLVDYVIGSQWSEAVVLLQVFGLTAAFNQLGFNWTVFLRARGETRPIAVVTVIGVGAFCLSGIPLLFAYDLPGFAAGIGVAAAAALAARCYYLKRIFPQLSIIRHSLRAIVPSVVPVGAVLLLRAVATGGRTEFMALTELAAYLVLSALATILLERRLLAEVLGYLRGGGTPQAEA